MASAPWEQEAVCINNVKPGETTSTTHPLLNLITLLRSSHFFLQANTVVHNIIIIASEVGSSLWSVVGSVTSVACNLYVP